MPPHTTQQQSNQLLARYVPPTERSPQLQKYLASAIEQNDHLRIEKFIEWALTNHSHYQESLTPPPSIIVIDASTCLNINGNDFSTTIDDSITDNSDNSDNSTIVEGAFGWVKFLLVFALVAGFFEFISSPQYREVPQYTNTKSK